MEHCKYPSVVNNSMSWWSSICNEEVPQRHGRSQIRMRRRFRLYIKRADRHRSDDWIVLTEQLLFHWRYEMLILLLECYRTNERHIRCRISYSDCLILISSRSHCWLSDWLTDVSTHYYIHTRTKHRNTSHRFTSIGWSQDHYSSRPLKSELFECLDSITHGTIYPPPV